jgi:hypothetical protein
LDKMASVMKSMFGGLRESLVTVSKRGGRSG